MLKFSCEKALLQLAVNTASRTVATKSSIPALEGLLLEGTDVLTLSGYNMQTGIRTRLEADIREGGRIVLNSRLFGDIIRKMPDDVIVFSADEKFMVTLTCGDARFEILGLSADDYPEMPEVESDYSMTVQQGILKAMINQTSFAVSTNENRPIHTGSLFEVGIDGVTVVSVDGFRLALRREKIEQLEGGAFRFVCPGSALNEVEKICEDSEEAITVMLGKRHLLFETGSTQLICRKLEGDFLDYKNAIPRNNPIRLTVDSKTMLSSLDRVSVVISEKLKSPVRCIMGSGCITMSAKTGNGEATDVCPVEGDGQGLRHDPCGRRRQLSLYGAAGAAEGVRSGKHENRDHYNGIYQIAGSAEAGGCSVHRRRGENRGAGGSCAGKRRYLHPAGQENPPRRHRDL